MAKKNVITIGDKVRKARELRGLTQFQLAIDAGVRQDTISRLEIGKGHSSLVSISRIAKALGTTIDSLMDGTPVIAGAAGSRQQAAGSRQQGAGSRQQAAGSQNGKQQEQQTAKREPQVASRERGKNT